MTELPKSPDFLTEANVSGAAPYMPEPGKAAQPNRTQSCRRLAGKPPDPPSLLPRRDKLVAVTWVLVLPTIFPASAFAETPEAILPEPELGPRKIFFMLFLMLGPIKILVPFVKMTRNCEVQFRRRLATRAIFFSAAALALAGLLGRSMLDNFDISVPVLAMTGGIVLFLVALQTVLQQSAGTIDPPKEDIQPTELKHALAPLAFPTIVTPYGIAAVIVFMTLAGGEYRETSIVAAIVLLILLLDWVAMLLAEIILRWVGTALQVFAVVLGVTQVALGLQVIMHSLSMIGVFAERAY